MYNMFSTLIILTSPYHRTIQGKEEDALKIIGKKAYKDLEATIYNLMDGRNFKAAATLKYSNRLHNDTVQKASAVRTYDLERSCVPPFRAKTYLEIFRHSPGGHELNYDPQSTAQTPTKKWECSPEVAKEEEEEEDELELDLRKAKGKWSHKWLYRDNYYLNPTQKIAFERELIEERRLMLESFKYGRELKNATDSGKENTKEQLNGSSKTEKEMCAEEEHSVQTEMVETEGEESVREKEVGGGGKNDTGNDGVAENGDGDESKQGSSKDLSNWVGGLEPAVGSSALRDLYLTMETMNFSTERPEDMEDFEEFENEP